MATREKGVTRGGEPRPVVLKKPASSSKPAHVRAGKAGGGAQVRARPRPRVRLLSPEQRLANSFRRTYRNAIGYFRETRLEMRKVVWPSRRETVVYTLVVVAATAIVGLVIWIYDIGLSSVLRMIIR